MDIEKAEKPKRNSDYLKPYQWPKGVSGNPAGRPPIPPELKKVKEVSSQILRRMISKHFGMTQEDLSLVIADPNAAAIDVLIAKTIMVCIENGNIEKAEYLFKRSFGVVENKLQISGKQLSGLGVKEKLVLIKSAIEFMEKAGENDPPEADVEVLDE